MTGTTSFLEKREVKLQGLHPFSTGTTGRKTVFLSPVVNAEATSDDTDLYSQVAEVMGDKGEQITEIHTHTHPPN